MADEVAVATPAERVMSLEGEQRQSWLKTGKLPEPEAPTESASSTDAPEKVAAVEPTKIEQEQPRKQSRSERRISELLNENKRLKSEAEKAVAKPVDDVSVKEPATEKKAAPIEAAKRPELKDFTTYEDWVEAVSDFKADQKITARLEEDRKQRETATKAAEVDKVNKEIEKGWLDMIEKAKAKYPDFEEVAFAKEKTSKIIKGSILDGWLLDSDEVGDIMYHTSAEELVRIGNLPPYKQARELRDLERTFSGKSPASTKVNTVTKAPKPPSEVGGTGTVSEDPVDAALARGNFRSYAEEMNRREIKLRKG